VAADSVEQAGLLQRARNDLERALATDSSLADALLTLSDLYYELPVPDVPRAQQLGERAYAADRSSENAPRVLTTLFWTNIDRESLQEAQRWCLEGYRRFPANSEFTRCRLWLMVTPQAPPNVDSAWALRTRIDSLTPSGFRRLEAELLVGGVIARAGLTDSARAVLDRAHAAMSREIDPYLQLSTREAYIRTLLGDDDRAIDLLEEFAAENPHYDLGQMLGNWWWQKLRADPRFQALLRSDREAP